MIPIDRHIKYERLFIDRDAMELRFDIVKIPDSLFDNIIKSGDFINKGDEGDIYKNKGPASNKEFTFTSFYNR